MADKRSSEDHQVEDVKGQGLVVQVRGSAPPTLVSDEDWDDDISEFRHPVMPRLSLTSGQQLKTGAFGLSTPSDSSVVRPSSDSWVSTELLSSLVTTAGETRLNVSSPTTAVTLSIDQIVEPDLVVDESTNSLSRSDTPLETNFNGLSMDID